MLTLFLLMALSFSGMAARAEAPESPLGMDYRIDLNSAYFTTGTNFQAGGGTTQDLNNGGYFTDIITTATYTQDLDRSRRVYGGFNYSATESSDGNTTRTNGGFNELLAGLQWWAKWSGYNVGPAADFVYPLFRVDRGTDGVLLGEGALKVRLGSWMNWTSGHWTPFIYAGYEYRDEGRSHAVPYTLGVKWRSSSLYVQAEYRGFERLFSNADSENRNSRDAFLQRVNGGSYRYYSINPSGSEGAIEAGLAIGPVTLYGGFAMTVNGSSYADGWTGMAGLAYSPQGFIKGPPTDEFDRINQPEHPLDDRFTPHVDPFDEFDPTKPPKEPRPRKKRPAPKPAAPPPVPAESAPQAPLKPAPKPKPKPKPAPPKKNKVDKMLEDTEKNLQGL